MNRNINRSSGTDLKIIIVGNSDTGKTSFANRWTKGEFTSVYKATIASEFSYKIYEIKGKYYRIQLWDIAGQDKSIKVTRVFCNDAHGVIVLSDVTKKRELKETLLWKNSISDCCKFLDGSELPMILVENKIDLLEGDIEQNIINTIKKGSSIDDYVNAGDYNSNSLSKSNGTIDINTNITNNNEFVGRFRTSVKNNINVNEAMSFLIEYIIEKLEKVSQEEINNIKKNRSNNITIDKDRRPSKVIEEKKKNCC